MYESDRNAQQLLNFIRPTNPEVAKESPTALEEFSCKRGDVNLHLLISRHHKNMRVLDYRIGNYQLKRNMLDRFAKQRGLRKIFTLVEKQDSNSWRTVGFSREAVVPAYFRTADAYVMSRVYEPDGEPLTGGLSKVAVEHEIPEPKNNRKPSGLRLTVYDDPDDLQGLVLSKKSSPLYTPFGKGIRHPEIAIRGRVGKKEVWLVAETNDSFGHAKIDLLSPPSTSREIGAAVYALDELYEHLMEMEMNNCFTFVSVLEEETNQVFCNADFRHTGQLTRHVSLEDEEPLDIHVWHKRLRPHKP
jgi:hypothetical protein